MEEEKALKPKFKFKLRGAFMGAGFKSVDEIAEATGFKANTLHTVFNGWRHPGPEVQAALARTLGISLRELQEML